VLGALNILAPYTAAAALITYIWPLAHGTGPFIAVAISYGYVSVGRRAKYTDTSPPASSISSGAYMTLCSIPIISMGHKDDVGRRIGVFQIAMAISSVVGAPISGAIFEHTHGYKDVGIYAG
jgi:MFS transporter, MCT family, solute carrier family 16 (monocarboxylic acid transporters), member 10